MKASPVRAVVAPIRIGCCARPPDGAHKPKPRQRPTSQRFLMQSIVETFLGQLLLRNPTTGVPACCARAASGQPTKLPPKNPMNRRLMGLTQGYGSRTNYSIVRRGKNRPLMSEGVKAER